MKNLLKTLVSAAVVTAAFGANAADFPAKDKVITIVVLGSYALVTAFGVARAGALAADPNPFHTAAKAFIAFVAPLITWVFLSSVTSSYVAANTQTSRVIYAGARGGLWSHVLAGVSPRFRTPAIAATMSASSLMVTNRSWPRFKGSWWSECISRSMPSTQSSM